MAPMQVEKLNFDTECVELVAPGVLAKVSVPTFEDDCAAEYPEEFPDYVAGHNFEFYFKDTTDQVNYIWYDSGEDKFIV